MAEESGSTFIRKQDRPALLTAVAVLILGNLILIGLQAPLFYALFVFPIAVAAGFVANYFVHGQFGFVSDSRIE